MDKLEEFSLNGPKNIDELTLLDGFPSNKKPARQWFNWLFNSLTKKINEIIEGKLDKEATSASATKLATARKIGGVSFDGTADIDLAGVNKKGDQDTSGNADTATKLKNARDIKITGVVQGNASFDGTGNIEINTVGGATLGEKAIAIIRLNGSTFDLVKSRGFASVTNEGSGQIEFTLSAEAPDLDYGVVCTGTSNRSDAVSLQEREDFARTKSKFRLMGAYGGDNTQGSYTPKICTVVVYY
ncbi:hypothetical protein OHV74_18955 [Acinetobacter baumannii]|nr:hypothetical protein [Acinetobacter baumannii]MDC4763577.1 hypothetical protein [Acinetobacter baumannii]